MKLPTNKKAEILAREAGARGCIITLYFGDHNHVALWFDKPIGKVNRADMIDMVDDVLSGTEELEKKIDADNDNRKYSSEKMTNSFNGAEESLKHSKGARKCNNE